MAKAKWIVLLCVLLIAAVPRLYSNGWDGYHALHPDERFMAMVSNDTSLPKSFSEYLDPNRSPLNPYNVKNASGGRQFPLFVYGTLPITVVKLVAKVIGQDHYTGYMKVGRVMSASADMLALLCWFLAIAAISQIYSWPRIVPSIFGIVYSVAVLPIQLSHFYTVDTFLNAGCAFALMAALYSRTTARLYWVALAGAGLGVALACKISALFFVPLVCAVVLMPVTLPLTTAAACGLLKAAAVRVSLMAVTGVCALRVGDPHLFESSSLLSLSVSPQFIANIQELTRLASRQEWPWPPSVQWIASTRVVSPLSNIFWFGLGPVISVLALCGLFSRRLWRAQLALFICAWSVLFFGYQGSRFAHTMRYFLPIYPVLALLAAHGFLVLSDRRVSLPRHLLSWGALLALILVWPLAFVSVYCNPHSRVEASRWIVNNIPRGSVIAVEHWDDGLPLAVDSRTANYVIRELGIFGEDTQQKWVALNSTLQGVNYIILSSNRGYGSMGRLPSKYPVTAAWYDSLFNETREWEKIYDLVRKPSIGIGPIRLEWDSQKAEEAFSVYDHPRVTIFRRKRAS
jgi:hypothetical protein